MIKSMKTFLNRLLSVMLMMTIASCVSETSEVNAQPSTYMGKTLVAYYSYTGNCRDIVDALTSKITADVIEIKPAEKGLRYEANGYALGKQLLNAIKAAPDDEASYPAIDPVSVSLQGYDNIIIVTPLWWSQMAAIMQAYLFSYGPQLAGKHIGLVVSSASSSIGQVVADCRRLVPDATWMGDALWINDGNRSRMPSLVDEWLAKQDFQTSAEIKNMFITIDGQAQRVALTNNEATKALVERLQEGPVTVTLSSNGDFEIWGALGFSLPTDNRQINAVAGDVILYNGNNICIMYGQNSWSYTHLGRIEGLTEAELRSFLKAGQSNIAVTLSFTEEITAIHDAPAQTSKNTFYSLDGRRIGRSANGAFIANGKKVIL